MDIEKSRKEEIKKKKERTKFLYRQIALCTKEIDDIRTYFKENKVSYRGMQIDVLIETLKIFDNWVNGEMLGKISGIWGRSIFTLLEPSVNHGRVLKEKRGGRAFYRIEPDEQKRKAAEHTMKRGPYDTRLFARAQRQARGKGFFPKPNDTNKKGPVV